MPNYLKYPDSKDTPSRKARKGSRAKVFITNASLASKLRKERRLARKEAAETLEAEGTEE